MQIIDNDKKLKVIQCSSEEMSLATGNPLPVCDNCIADCENGYYVAVINRWLCESCYQEFMEYAKRYEEDCEVENRNFDTYLGLLKKAETIIKLKGENK